MRLSLWISHAGFFPHRPRAATKSFFTWQPGEGYHTTSVQMLPENNLVGRMPDSDSGEPNFPYKAPDSRVTFPKRVRTCEFDETINCLVLSLPGNSIRRSGSVE